MYLFVSGSIILGVPLNSKDIFSLVCLISRSSFDAAYSLSRNDKLDYDFF